MDGKSQGAYSYPDRSVRRLMSASPHERRKSGRAGRSRVWPIPDIAATTTNTEAFRLTSWFALSEEWCAGLHPQHDPTTSLEVAALHPDMLYGREHVAEAPLQRATFINRCSTADVIGYGLQLGFHCFAIPSEGRRLLLFDGSAYRNAEGWIETGARKTPTRCDHLTAGRDHVVIDHKRSRGPFDHLEICKVLVRVSRPLDEDFCFATFHRRAGIAFPPVALAMAVPCSSVLKLFRSEMVASELGMGTTSTGPCNSDCSFEATV